jgi:hypothetical protein
VTVAGAVAEGVEAIVVVAAVVETTVAAAAAVIVAIAASASKVNSPKASSRSSGVPR